MKPDIGGEAMRKDSPDLPGCLGTARRNRSVEESGRPGRAGKGNRPQRPEGMNNRGNGSGRESERPIVARKRGNARGAKGPHWKHGCCKRKGEPLGRDSRYGRMGAYRSPEETGEWRRTPRQTLFAETEAEPKGQAGTEVPVLFALRRDLSARWVGSGMETGASQQGRAWGGRREDRTD